MKRLTITLFCLLCAAALWAQDAFKPNTAYCYKTTPQGKLMLDVFLPAKHKASDKRPVIVFFFGGGWATGAPNQFYQQARYFADKGFVAISADYRTFKKHGTTPFECVKDGKSAIRWVREHAKELGIDVRKVVASGGSAGGHVAACTGLISDYEEEGENLTISSEPNAMVLFNPVIDTGEKGYGMKKVGEDRKTDISPVHHVAKGIVPTIIFHGTADKTVPFENAERFAKLMKEAGNTCELVPFPGKGHGFFNGSFFKAQLSDEDLYVTMKKSYAFLSFLLK